jgi:plasmid maintenance system antidote protein VapI
MEYSFEIVGVSPVLEFFNHQQAIRQQRHAGAEYLGSYQCTLDAFITSVENVPMRRNWRLDRIVDSVINFWLNNAEQISHWKQRLREAGTENLLVARVGDVESLKAEFESLLKYDG